MLYDYKPEPASLPRRWFGQFIDSIVAILLPVLVVVALTWSGGESLWRTLVGVLLYIGYILFADGFNDGRSLGKMVVGTQVTDAEMGEPCTFWQSFLRNIFYILGIIDWIFIFGDRRQRLGGKAAHTVVVMAAE